MSRGIPKSWISVCTRGTGGALAPFALCTRLALDFAANVCAPYREHRYAKKQEKQKKAILGAIP